MKRVIIAIVVLVVVFVGYKLVTFELFDDEIEQLEKVDIPEETFDIGIYLIPSNATVQGSIQLRKLYDKDDIQETVANYERYNKLVGFKLLTGQLTLIIEDTIREKTDTVIYSF